MGVQAFTELGTGNIMKLLLAIALFGAVQARPEPWHYYGYPYVPLVYTHPIKLVATNVCRNLAGEEVACAHGIAPESSLYSYNGAPAPVVEEPAEEVNIADLGARTEVIARKKREAEAEPEAEADPYLLYSGYYGHPGYYGYGYGLGYGWGGYYGLRHYGYYGLGGCRNVHGALVPCA